MSQAPLRGKRGRERRLGERLEADRLQRAAEPRDGETVDFDVAEAEREVEDERRREEAARAAAAAPRAPAGARPPRAGRRLPDLSVLPSLLHDSGTFGALRERLRPVAGDGQRAGRHAGLVAVPHGAKTFLAAALALGPDAERLVWIARDAEIGDRVAEELAAWLGDPAAVATLEPRTALAYERSELVADETAARVAALARWRRAGSAARVLVASVQALVQHTIAPDDLPDRPLLVRAGERLGLEDLLRRLQSTRVQPRARGCGARRVRASRRDRRRVPAQRGAADPHRVLRRRDRLAAPLRSDRPARRRAGRAHRAAAGIGVPRAPGRDRRPPRPRSRCDARSRSASPRTSPDSRPPRVIRRIRRIVPRGTRRRAGGRSPPATRRRSGVRT